MGSVKRKKSNSVCDDRKVFSGWLYNISVYERLYTQKHREANRQMLPCFAPSKWRALRFRSAESHTTPTHFGSTESYCSFTHPKNTQQELKRELIRTQLQLHFASACDRYDKFILRCIRCPRLNIATVYCNKIRGSSRIRANVRILPMCNVLDFLEWQLSSYKAIKLLFITVRMKQRCIKGDRLCGPDY